MSDPRALSRPSIGQYSPSDMRKAATFVLNDMRDKLEEMTLHDDTGDPHDEGYMAAVREMREWVDLR